MLEKKNSSNKSSLNTNELADYIKKEVNGFYSHYLSFEKNATMILNNGGKKPLDALLIVPPNESMFTPYARIGDTILLENWIGHIAKNIQLNENIIYTLRDETSLYFQNIGYSGTTMQALNSLDLKDETILDLGCGCGLLSIFAMKKGAKKSYGIDNKRSLRKKFYTQCKGLNKVDCEFIHADIMQSIFEKKFNKPPKYIKKIPREDIDIVVAQIGPQPIYKDGVHLAAIQSLDYLPNANTFVGGGYTYLPDNNTLSPNKAVEELRKRGFTQIQEVKMHIEDSKNSYLLAFIAKCH